MTNQKPLDIFEYTYEEREDLWNRIIKQPLDPKYLKQRQVGDKRVALFYTLMMFFVTASPAYALAIYPFIRWHLSNASFLNDYGVYMAVEINYQANRVINMKDMRWCVKNDLPLNHDMKELFHEVCNYTKHKYMEPEEPQPVIVSIVGCIGFVLLLITFLWIASGIISISSDFSDSLLFYIGLFLFVFNFWFVPFTLFAGTIWLNAWLNDKSDFKKWGWKVAENAVFSNKIRAFYIEMLRTMSYGTTWIKPHPSAMDIENGSSAAYSVSKNYEQQRHQYDLQIQELQNEIAEIWNNKRRGDDG